MKLILSYEVWFCVYGTVEVRLPDGHLLPTAGEEDEGSSCASAAQACCQPEHTQPQGTAVLFSVCRDAGFPLFSIFSVIFGLIRSPPIRFPFFSPNCSVCRKCMLIFSILSYFIFLFLNFLSLFVFIFCETARTCRFSVIFAKVQWHPCV